MYLTIQGVVLRVSDYNDHDALLTVLTRKHGKLTVKARGLRRKNSPLAAVCQLLAYGEFTVFEYRGQYTINEAHSIELFSPLRRSLTKLSLATYFAQASEMLSQEDLPNPELLSLLLNSLYLISEQKAPLPHIKAVYELRLCSECGFLPQLLCCKGCGLYDGKDFYLDLQEGTLWCADCAAKAGKTPNLDPGALYAVRHICLAEDKKVFSFRISEASGRRLAAVAERYALLHLDGTPKSYAFLKSVL